MVDSRNRDGKCSKPSRNPLSKIDIGTISELQAVNLLINSGFHGLYEQEKLSKEFNDFQPDKGSSKW